MRAKHLPSSRAKLAPGQEFDGIERVGHGQVNSRGPISKLGLSHVCNSTEPDHKFLSTKCDTLMHTTIIITVIITRRNGRDDEEV